MPNCYTCGNLIPIENLYEHGLLTHAITICSPIYCGEFDCYKKFSNLKLFKRHWLNMHNIKLNLVSNDSTQNTKKKNSYQRNSTIPICQ